uniref:HAT C-terminal dimerisation domain-containing protein n=1 Tax=Amphiprion percula TaxID=161767 RepID=A0A3P8SYK1_AMPPE
MSAPKRKLDQENRIFQARWETDYLFTEFKGKPMCLVCLETKSAMKYFKSPLEHHAQGKFEKYTGATRAAIVADLKGKIHRQQSLFTKTTTTQESALKASYIVTLELAKAKKPLSNGEMVKRCAIEMAKSFRDDNMDKNFETVSLSCRTVTRRIFDIQNHVEEKLKEVMNDCKYFSLVLDESTDVTAVSQLLIFTRTIDSSFEVHKELLKLVSLHETTKGMDIFSAVKMVVNEHVGFGKLSAAVTDGAPSMQERHTGFDGVIHQNGVDCLVLGNRALNHRNFVAFLEEVNAAYGDLQMHTDIRWTSHGKCLERFFALRTELPCVFGGLSLLSYECVLPQTPGYSFSVRHGLSYRYHLTFKSSQHTAAEQMPNCVRPVCAHECFLAQTGTVLRRFLPSYKEMYRGVPECEKIFPKYRADIETLLQQFNDRYQDFHTMQPRVALFTAPLSAAVGEQPMELQLELLRQMRRDFILETAIESHFPLCRDFSLSIASMFGSTCTCESSFSTMKHIKSKERNRLTDETLFQLMQIGSTKIDIDIQNFVQQQARPQVSH